MDSFVTFAPCLDTGNKNKRKVTEKMAFQKGHRPNLHKREVMAYSTYSPLSDSVPEGRILFVGKKPCAEECKEKKCTEQCKREAKEERRINKEHKRQLLTHDTRIKTEIERGGGVDIVARWPPMWHFPPLNAGAPAAAAAAGAALPSLKVHQLDRVAGSHAL